MHPFEFPIGGGQYLDCGATLFEVTFRGGSTPRNMLDVLPELQSLPSGGGMSWRGARSMSCPRMVLALGHPDLQERDSFAPFRLPLPVL